jgi:hypothetical protein
MAGELCYLKGGSALAYSKIASNNGALIYKNGGWYMEIELVPKTDADDWTGISGKYISTKNGNYVSGYYWRCYDAGSILSMSQRDDSKRLFTRVTDLKFRTGIIDANAGDTIDLVVPMVTSYLDDDKVILSSFSDVYDLDGVYKAGYSYVTGFGHDIYVTSYSDGGQEIQRERCVWSGRTNPPYPYAWATFKGESGGVSIEIMKLTITKDGADKGKFKLSYANP